MRMNVAASKSAMLFCQSMVTKVGCMKGRDRIVLKLKPWQEIAINRHKIQLVLNGRNEMN